MYPSGSCVPIDWAYSSPLRLSPHGQYRLAPITPRTKGSPSLGTVTVKSLRTPTGPIEPDVSKPNTASLCTLAAKKPRSKRPTVKPPWPATSSPSRSHSPTSAATAVMWPVAPM